MGSYALFAAKWRWFLKDEAHAAFLADVAALQATVTERTPPAPSGRHPDGRAGRGGASGRRGTGITSRSIKGERAERLEAEVAALRARLKFAHDTLALALDCDKHDKPACGCWIPDARAALQPPDQP
jgi:hypothetical protein